MTGRRGGLGRGLGALIPQSSAHPEAQEGSAAATVRYRELPVHDISANPKQPRTVFDEGALAELVASVREIGVLQPIVVRETTPGRYELVMGERRLRACRAAGLATVPAIIKDTPDEALLRNALLENLHREDLNPLEEAAAYEQLLHEFGVTHEQLAERVGRSRSHVTNTIRLLHLPPAVQRRVAAGVISAGHARALLGLPSREEQEELAGRIVAEGLSVRATEELVATGGADQPPVRRPPRTGRLHAPGLSDLAERLSDRFDTRVTVELGRRKGRIVVDFGSIDDLERIIAVMAPGDAPRATARLADGQAPAGNG
ncbi:MAG: ParB/RepB/Spo0J family partition protein [Actinomycetota bacterium]|nr:ParB/RepB/Spo0J family partition protein [Actinomycetota bacterium]